MERSMSRFIGIWMEAERAKALRVVAARRNVSVSELIRQAAEAQYGDEMDTEQAGVSASTVLRAVNKRAVR